MVCMDWVDDTAELGSMLWQVAFRKAKFTTLYLPVVVTFKPLLVF